MGLFTFAGVLEGFYGNPWTWAERRAVMERAVPAGLAWFAWAPKGDPLHRDEWRTAFTDDHLQGFADLLTIEGIHLCIGIAPGPNPGVTVQGDADTLVAKLEPVVQLVEAVGSHVPMVMVAFDDLGADLTDPVRHGAIVSALSNAFGDRVVLAAVPVQYAGVTRTDYLEQFSASLPPDVLVGWTGPMVVNDSIDAAAAEAFSDAVDGRPLLLWDNYPVNDALMTGQLFLHPLRGRDSLLSEFCPAYFANAAVQPQLSLPPLLSAAAFCETGFSVEVWDEFEQPVQVALLAEACDGGELYRLGEIAIGDTESKEFDDLWWWLERIEVLELGGPLGAEASPWVTQANAEAELCLVAMDLLDRAPDDADVPNLVVEVWRRWPSIRRSTVNVFGHRLAVRPTMGVHSDGAWHVDAPSVVRDKNVTDLLCDAALQRHTVSDGPGSGLRL